jgi:hypothetical protein
MSAPISIFQAQTCVHAALCDEVVAIGGVALAAAETGSSEDTVRRRLAGTHDWTGKEIGALYAAALRRQGRSLLVDRLTDLGQGTAPKGDGRRAFSDLSSTLPALLTQAQTMAQAAADGDVSRQEARALLAGLPSIISDLERMSADLVALLRDPS